MEEITEDSSDYDTYAANTESALGMEEGSAGYIRLFDIKIVDKDDSSIKYQPAEGKTVDVRIELADSENDDLNVVHFSDNEETGDVIESSAEKVEEGSVVAFAANGFSVYAIASSGSTSNLSGKTFAIINTYTNNAIQASILNDKKLSAVKVAINKEYVSVNDDISLWKLENAGNGRYNLQSEDGKYLRINGNNNNGTVTISNTKQALNVTAGDGNHAGQIRLTNTNNIAVNNYSGSTAGGFGTYNDGGNNEWFTLYELEKITLNPAYNAEKISVQDIQDAQQVILYKSVYNETAGKYEDYVIDGNGNLVKAYDKGDKVVGRSGVSPVWTVTFHRDEITNELNGYYDFYNTSTGLYLSPQSDGTLVSSIRPGVTLNGRRDGEYNSTIEVWDSSAWAWYGCQITKDENGDVSLESGTGNESQPFSFAAYVSEATSELHPVKTVDSVSAGITMKMYDFSTRDQLTKVVDGNTYIEGNYYNNSGLASKTLINGFPYFESTRKSASDLFNSNNYKGDANRLFLESVYDSTGYYEYSSFNNYAFYENGSFTVYQETGTPSNDNKYFYKRGNFYPYNKLDVNRVATNRNNYDGSGNNLDILDPTNDGTLYMTDGKNDYFGMTMEFSFMQPKNGYNNGGPMIYEFNGDDDLWV